MALFMVSLVKHVRLQGEVEKSLAGEFCAPNNELRSNQGDYKTWVFSLSTCEQGLFMVVRLTMELQAYLLYLENKSLKFSLVKHRSLTYGKSLDKGRLV